ncbi:MAG: hypothetical protein Roseis2KO_42290 [Roseivirga sp.]
MPLPLLELELLDERELLPEDLLDPLEERELLPLLTDPEDLELLPLLTDPEEDLELLPLLRLYEPLLEEPLE